MGNTQLVSSAFSLYKTVYIYQYINMRESLKKFKALCDETRLKIVEFLFNGEKRVCEIVPFTKRIQSTVSIQLGKLEGSGIVESRREGKKVYYRLTNKKVKEILKIVKIDRTMIQIIQKIKISEVSLC